MKLTLFTALIATAMAGVEAHLGQKSCNSLIRQQIEHFTPEALDPIIRGPNSDQNFRNLASIVQYVVYVIKEISGVTSSVKTKPTPNFSGMQEVPPPGSQKKEQMASQADLDNLKATIEAMVGHKINEFKSEYTKLIQAHISGVSSKMQLFSEHIQNNTEYLNASLNRMAQEIKGISGGKLAAHLGAESQNFTKSEVINEATQAATSHIVPVIGHAWTEISKQLITQQQNLESSILGNYTKIKNKFNKKEEFLKNHFNRRWKDSMEKISELAKMVTSHIAEFQISLGSSMSQNLTVFDKNSTYFGNGCETGKNCSEEANHTVKNGIGTNLTDSLLLNQTQISLTEKLIGWDPELVEKHAQELKSFIQAFNELDTRIPLLQEKIIWIAENVRQFDLFEKIKFAERNRKYIRKLTQKKQKISTKSDKNLTNLTAKNQKNSTSVEPDFLNHKIVNNQQKNPSQFDFSEFGPNNLENSFGHKMTKIVNQNMSHSDHLKFSSQTVDIKMGMKNFLDPKTIILEVPHAQNYSSIPKIVLKLDSIGPGVTASVYWVGLESAIILVSLNCHTDVNRALGSVIVETSGR